MERRKRVALVTGAAQGIGQATAVRLQAEGYCVVGLDVRDPGPEFGIGPITVAGKPSFLHCDVSDEAQVLRALAAVREALAAVDVLVNNAGMVLTKSLAESRLDDFQTIFRINVGSQFLMCKHILPLLLQARAAAIVNVASVSGYVGSVNNTLYCATKGAVQAFTKALAVELAPHAIRVNSVSPGYVDTPMLREDLTEQSRLSGLTADEVIRREQDGQLFGRFASPAEVAEAICFLAGDGASFITGADLLVDCGWVAR